MTWKEARNVPVYRLKQLNALLRVPQYSAAYKYDMTNASSSGAGTLRKMQGPTGSGTKCNVMVI